MRPYSTLAFIVFVLALLVLAGCARASVPQTTPASLSTSGAPDVATPLDKDFASLDSGTNTTQFDSLDKDLGQVQTDVAA